jgi:excinuclease ABC subunit C
MKKFKFLLKEKMSYLPKESGVYAFKKGAKLLYIGKATNIRERVKNHFSQPVYRDNLFINQVKKIGYIKTDSEIEALILEANLIKKYQPKYNVVWRDDKNYFFVGIAKENFPRVFITHQPVMNKGLTTNDKRGTKNEERPRKEKVISHKSLVNYVGPFVDGKSLKATLKSLRKVFPHRSCKSLPNRPCLWYHLNRCPAPCLLKTSDFGGGRPSADFGRKMRRECQKNVKNLMKILKEGKNPVLKRLRREMKLASKNQDFETAGKIRDQIEALERIVKHAKIFEELIVPQTSRWYYKKVEEGLKKLLKIKRKISRIEAYDVSNIVGQQATGSMVTFINGQPNKNFYRRFKIKITGKPNDIAMLKEILTRRLKHSEWGFPDLILIDGGRAQLNAASQITQQSYKPVGRTVHLMALAKKRNELYLESRKEPLRLNSLPNSLKFVIWQLRDEAHRFAITYHKKLRERSLIP